MFLIPKLYVTSKLLELRVYHLIIFILLHLLSFLESSVTSLVSRLAAED